MKCMSIGLWLFVDSPHGLPVRCDIASLGVRVLIILSDKALWTLMILYDIEFCRDQGLAVVVLSLLHHHQILVVHDAFRGLAQRNAYPRVTTLTV